MMYKGLELIEAKWLATWRRRISKSYPPRGIVHSAVEFDDGAVLAQLGLPDMRLPIQYALDAGRNARPAEVPRLRLAEAAARPFSRRITRRFRRSASPACGGAKGRPRRGTQRGERGGGRPVPHGQARLCRDCGKRRRALDAIPVKRNSHWTASWPADAAAQSWYSRTARI